MSKNATDPKDLQPLWRRIGKGIAAAGIAAAYATGIALAAPITLSITAGLGALRGLATRDPEKQGLLNAIGTGAVQGMLAPFGASATLAVDAVKGQKTEFDDILLNSGKKMPDIPGFGRNSSDQPLWKRAAKVIVGAAMIGGTIAACTVAGPAVAAFVAVAGITGAYKGYKEAKAENKNRIWGAIKGAVNRVISPIASGALLISHGVQGCETKSLAVNVFDDVAGQFAPSILDQKTQKDTPPPLPTKPEHLRGNKIHKEQPTLPQRLSSNHPVRVAVREKNARQVQEMRDNLGKPTAPINHAKQNSKGQLPPALKPKKQFSR